MDIFANALVGVVILAIVVGIVIFSVKKNLNLKWIAWYTVVILTIMHIMPLFNAHLNGELWHTPTLIFVYWLILKKKI